MHASYPRISKFWVLVPFLVGVLTVMMVGDWLQPASADPAKETKKTSAAQLDLVVTVPHGGCADGSPCTKASTLEQIRGLKTFRVDSFFDIEYVRVYRNIGSSGQDGVKTGARFAMDSFFDINVIGDPDFDQLGDPDFDIFGDPDFDLLRISARGTLVDASNPAAVLDELDQLLRQRHELKGHVTLIR